MKRLVVVLLLIVAAFVVTEHQPQMVEISHVDSTGMYVNYVSHDGDLYTDVYIEDAPIEVQAIAKAEEWDGCHWDAPAIVYSESVEGTTMSAQAATVIDALKAEEYEEDE